MREVSIEGQPVLVSQRDKYPRTERIRKKRKKSIREKGIEKLTPKQKNALVNYVNKGCNPQKKKEAAVEAGYHPNTGKRSLDNILKSNKMLQALDKAKVNEELIAEKIKEGLDAKHPFKPQQKDFHAIIKYIKEFNSLKGHYAPQKIEGEQKHIHVHITKDDKDTLERYKEISEES